VSDDVATCLRKIVAEERAREMVMDGEQAYYHLLDRVEALTGPDALVAAIAQLTHQVERIADQGVEADVHVTIEKVLEAWEAIGQRSQQHLPVEFLDKLGVVVDS